MVYGSGVAMSERASIVPRLLGAGGVAAGMGVYLASFYNHQLAWRWSGLAGIAAGVGALAFLRFFGPRRQES